MNLRTVAKRHFCLLRCLPGWKNNVVEGEADMHSSLVAITVSAAIAAAFAVLTEPFVSAQSGLPKPAAISISKPAVKGDRIYLHPMESCLFAHESFSERNNCPLRPVQPAQHPLHRPTVIINLWPTESTPALAVANAKRIV